LKTNLRHLSAVNVRDMGVLALSLVIIFGLLLFERVNFPYGNDVVSNERLARLQGLSDLKSVPNSNSDQAILITGHRGSGVAGNIMIDGDLEETIIGNTRRGILRAVKANIDFIEIDLRAFAGGENDLVLYHDSNLGKLVLPSNLVASGAREMEDLWLSEIKDSRYRTSDLVNGEADRIVLFSEFLELASGSKQNIILDLKFSDRFNEAEVIASFEKILDQLNKHSSAYKSVTIFGDFQVLRQWIAFVRTRDRRDDFDGRAARLGYTVLAKHNQNRFDILFRPSQIFERWSQLQMPGSEAPILVLPVNFASGPMLSRADEKGVDVWVYGTEDPRDWRMLEERGVNGFILDDPAAYSK